MKAVIWVATKSILLLLTLVFGVAILLTKKGSKKNAKAKRGLAVIYAWDDDTYRRAADFCAKTEQRAAKDGEYLVRHRRRIELSNEMESLMKLYRSF